MLGIGKNKEPLERLESIFKSSVYEDKGTYKQTALFNLINGRSLWGSNVCHFLEETGRQVSQRATISPT